MRTGPIEIIERWTRDRLVVIADRKVIIRDERNPFGHGLIPFVAATPLPKDDEVVGWSMAEILGEMQCAAWDAMNHRTDNAKIMSNAVMKVRAGVPDMDDVLKRFPGQAVILDNPAADLQWDVPPTSIIEPLIEAEQRIAQTMQDLSGAVAYLSGAGEGTVDQTTATGISIIQSTAQKRLLFMKQEYANADNRRGQQWIELAKALMSIPLQFSNQAAGEYEFDALWPHEMVDLNCKYQVSDVAESLNQQQKRSEAILKLNTLLQSRCDLTLDALLFTLRQCGSAAISNECHPDLRWFRELASFNPKRSGKQGQHARRGVCLVQLIFRERLLGDRATQFGGKRI